MQPHKKIDKASLAFLAVAFSLIPFVDLMPMWMLLALLITALIFVIYQWMRLHDDFDNSTNDRDLR